MKSVSLFGISAALFFLLFLGMTVELRAQHCENQGLAFDGAGDNINLNLTNTPINGAGDFSVEAWFNANPVTSFQILFTLSGSAPFSVFSLGLIPGGQLALYWQNTPNNGGTAFPVLIPTNPANLEGACHHIAVSRQGGTIGVYLNGTLLTTLSTAIGPYNFDQFLVGTSGGTIPLSQDWDGIVDEIRLWSVARTTMEIVGAKDCVLSQNIPGMEVYWTLDEGADAGNPNPGMTTATDFSGNLNHGTLNGFALNGALSNWVCMPCMPRYELIITDDPSAAPTLLTTICSGDPVNVCITENFGSVNPIPGASVDWEFSDDNGQNWGAVTDPIFQGYCFGVPKGVIDISAICATSTTGYVDRIYRAKIVKTSTNPPFTCTYTTSEHHLRICCSPTGTVTLTPVPPFNPPVNTLCEGTVTIQVALTGPPFLPSLPIEWCIDGVHVQGFDNMTSFTYTGPANAPDICFEAKIQNCACPPATVKACLPVDPRPVCSNLIIDQLFSNVIPDPLGGPYDYLICPGGQETLGYTGSVQNCTPVWQYRFDFPLNDPWKDISSTNFWLFTNTLPLLSPPNPATSPFLWPANANCIYYRIECRPESYPNSDCPPCYSNDLRICLKPNPLLTPVIAANPNPICEGGTAQISNTVSDPNVTQEQWFCNGLSLGPPQAPGSTLTATQQACYVLSVTDGCYTKFSNRECLIVCDPVSIIKCPEDNPCACLGMPSTFDGTMSYSNCAPIVLYEWKVQDLPNGPIQQFLGPMLTYTVPAGGSSITLCVTDSNGCMEVSKTLDIVPCE